MTEAYNNTNPCNLESLSDDISNSDRDRQREETIAQADISKTDSSELPLNDKTKAERLTVNNATTLESDCSSNLKMNWQKVAHKLREYNRKLLKKVFRLEQELSDIDNKYKKQIDKARTSDILVAQQESEIKKYQEQSELFDRQLATLQTTIDRQEVNINTLSEQYQFSQQQTAKLERQCTLIKEECDRQTYELSTTEKQLQELQIEVEQQQELTAQYKAECDRQNEKLIAQNQQLQELQTKLERQQRLAIQYKAELQRDRQPVTTIPPKTAKTTKTTDIKRYSDRRTIEPWSNPDHSESKIALPKTKPLPLTPRKTASSETVTTAAKIATWNASQAKSTTQKQATKETATKSSMKVKPKSLAAIDLPTFPRQ